MVVAAATPVVVGVEAVVVVVVVHAALEAPVVAQVAVPPGVVALPGEKLRESWSPRGVPVQPLSSTGSTGSSQAVERRTISFRPV